MGDAVVVKIELLQRGAPWRGWEYDIDESVLAQAQACEVGKAVEAKGGKSSYTGVVQIDILGRGGGLEMVVK